MSFYLVQIPDKPPAVKTAETLGEDFCLPSRAEMAQSVYAKGTAYIISLTLPPNEFSLGMISY